MATTLHYGVGSTVKVTDNNNTESDSNKATGNANNFFRNLSGYNDIESYTIGGIIDDLYLALLCTKEIVTDHSNKEVVISKYYFQAWKLQRLISVGQRRLTSLSRCRI